MDRPDFAERAIAVECLAGFPHDIDALADLCADERGFLRSAWFAAASDKGETLVVRDSGGGPVVAVPIAPCGSPLVGMRAVPGSYWPFRSIQVSPAATPASFAAALRHPIGREALGTIWRVGPIYAEDPAVPLVRQAAALAGWTCLTRHAGRTWLIDLDEDCWPSRSTRRRLGSYEKRLNDTGSVRVDHVSGKHWTRRTLAMLGMIEAHSWVASRTDGSGAKFLTAEHRRHWRRMLEDPNLASALSATILFSGETPVAFSFDLKAGRRQYALASSYDDRFRDFRPGSIVTCHQFDRARAAGVTLVDLGLGDSGYKQGMGARPGPEVVDLLVVRSRPAASLLRRQWGAEPASVSGVVRSTMIGAGGLGAITPWLTASAIAAAALAIAE